jgi:hypothetical protein
MVSGVAQEFEIRLANGSSLGTVLVADMMNPSGSIISFKLPQVWLAFTKFQT